MKGIQNMCVYKVDICSQPEIWKSSQTPRPILGAPFGEQAACKSACSEEETFIKQRFL